jgi:hypothetical protein
LKPPAALHRLTRDAWLLFATRFIRLFAYGSLSVVLVFYLIGLGLSESQTGMLLTLTLMGDTVVSLFLTTRADRIGRRRMLIVGAVLMAGAGLVFASTRHLWLLVLAGTIGVISPSGNEVGPFLSIEQAALAHTVSHRIRTEVFAWYTLAGSLATGLGALAGGTVTNVLQGTVSTPVNSYRMVVILYSALGLILAFLFTRLSRAVEASTLGEQRASRATVARLSGLDRSRSVVVKLAALFALDSFAGGFVILLAVRRQPGNARCDLFLGEHLCRDLGVARLPARRALRPDQHHGGHAPAIQHSPDSRAPDADIAARHLRAPGALQHQPDGRADEAVLPHGGRSSRGAIRGIGDNGCCAHDGRGHQSRVRRIHVQPPLVDQPAVLHRGELENCVRPAAL